MAKFNIGIVGVPGAGKTTLSRALAGAVRKNAPDIKTVELVAEYARVYIHKYGFQDIVDQLLILAKQVSREDAYPESTDLMITDSPIFLGAPYSIDMCKIGSIRDNKILTEILKQMVKLNVTPRYDIIFHLPPTIKPVRDGIRSEEQFDDEWREQFDQKIKGAFTIFRPRHFITLESTDVHDRIAEASEHIRRILTPPIELIKPAIVEIDEEEPGAEAEWYGKKRYAESTRLTKQVDDPEEMSDLIFLKKADEFSKRLCQCKRLAPSIEELNVTWRKPTRNASFIDAKSRKEWLETLGEE